MKFKPGGAELGSDERFVPCRYRSRPGPQSQWRLRRSDRIDSVHPMPSKPAESSCGGRRRDKLHLNIQRWEARSSPASLRSGATVLPSIMFLSRIRRNRYASCRHNGLGRWQVDVLEQAYPNYTHADSVFATKRRSGRFLRNRKKYRRHRTLCGTGTEKAVGGRPAFQVSYICR